MIAFALRAVTFLLVEQFLLFSLDPSRHGIPSLQTNYSGPGKLSMETLHRICIPCGKHIRRSEKSPAGTLHKRTFKNQRFFSLNAESRTQEVEPS